MASDTASFRPDDPLAQGELAELVAGLTGKPAPRGHEAARAGLAGGTKRSARACARARRSGCCIHAARAERRPRSPQPLRHRGGRTVARPAHEPSGGSGQARAPPGRPRDPCGGGVLGRPDPAAPEGRVGRHSCRDGVVLAAHVRRVAATDPHERRRTRRLPVRVGRRERTRGRSVVAVRSAGARRLRLLRLHLARLQAAGPSAGGRVGRCRARSHDIRAGRRDAAGSQDSVDQIAPGDLLFFGARGPRSHPAQVDHVAIYAGSGWMVHSSVHGVTLAPLSDWFRKSFAWARRPLAEAGLVAPPPVGR